MHGFLIIPHQHRISYVKFRDQPSNEREEIKRILKTVAFVEAFVFPNGNILCLYDGYDKRNRLIPFVIRSTAGEQRFGGKALLIGKNKEGNYTSPLTSEEQLIGMLFYPKVDL